MVVAIHQPNYFPWLGYFQKIASSDVFVFLDHVPLPQGRSYTQRVQILCQGDRLWLTVPVLKSGRSGQRIDELDYNPTEDWRSTHLKTLRMNYANHPQFDMVFPLVEDILAMEVDLATLNSRTVQSITERLGLDCRFVRSSDLSLPDVQKNELLATITSEVGGEVYLHGSGAEEYQDEAVFESYGLELLPRKFEHPQYLQDGSESFVEGLSVLDALFNVGFKGTGSMLADAG